MQQALALELPAPAPAASRIAFIDTAKAVGIVLVVAGHVPEAPPLIVTLIYSFHMPLFFFISGYLLTPQRVAAHWGVLLRRGLRSLMVPYLFFFLLSFAYWMATRNLGARAQKFAGVDAADAWYGLFTGLSQDLFVNPTLWFFPCLFLCQLIYAAARRRLSDAAALAAFTGLAVLLLWAAPWNSRLPWGLGIVWIALPFYAAGHCLRWRGWAGGALGPWASQLWALPWLLLALFQGREDLARASFGPVPLLYLPCALAGIACLVQAARLITPGPALRWLADNSLVIFPLHPLLINFFSGLAQMVVGRELMERNALAWWLVAVLCGLLACVPAAALLRRYVPGLLGLRT